MKNLIGLLGLLGLIASMPLRAETAQQMDQQFMQMLQARAEEQRMEEEFKNPKKPEVQKDRAILGNRNAPILLVAYSDFQCPYCKQGAETVAELRKKYKTQLAFVFKNLPLSFHPMAMPAAKRFEAIALQSAKKAYDFHDAVFKNQDQLGSKGEAFLDETAKSVGANVAKMKKDMESDKVTKRIEADGKEASSFQISGTPGFVVAGVTVKGAYPVPYFEQIIEKRLAEKKRGVSSK